VPMMFLVLQLIIKQVSSRIPRIKTYALVS